MTVLPRKRIAVAVFGAVTLMLLAAAANVAALLLARGAGRRLETALRASLGAGRGRILRQHLTESLTLALIGGLAGLGVAWAGLDLLGVRHLPLGHRPGADRPERGKRRSPVRGREARRAAELAS